MNPDFWARLTAIATLVSGGAALAQNTCDCTDIVASCEATATAGDGFIEISSDGGQCSRVDYLVNGIPLVSMVVGGTERQDLDNAIDASNVTVASCQVCRELTAAEAGIGGSGLYAEGAVSALIQVSPDYPAAALNTGIEGFVELRFEVDMTGSVRSPEVVAAEPAGVFDQAALDAIRQWRYTIPAGEPQTVTETMTFDTDRGVLALRPSRNQTAARVVAARNGCIQEQTRFDFGAMIDVSLINACEQPLLVYSCSAGTGSFADRWVCSNPENAGTVIQSVRSSGQPITSADGSEAFAAIGTLDITRAPNGEYWLLACTVDDLNCRSDGREWVRSLNRQTATIDPQARTRARLARSY